jgi:Topoisomerase 6 subunit A/Spo11, Toprim domain
VKAALDKLGARWIRHRDRQLRVKTAILPSAPKPERVTIKDAVNELLPECYDIASSNGAYPTSPRQIYYVLRPKVLQLTGKETLDYGYFAANLLPRYLQDNPTDDWRIYFKARGTLREPHTARQIPLGTAEVSNYQRRWTNGEAKFGFDMPDWSPDTVGPQNRFGGLLVVEKDGIADLLILAGVGERFDLAIVGNEGQSVEAELRLADALGLPVFVLHDFDRTGLTICQNLREGTWRYRYQNEFEVIEIGLRLDQVRDLEKEPISKENLKSVGDDRLVECGAVDEEVEFLRSHRVELNALITEDLVKLVETALTEHGIEKLVPDDDDLVAAWRSAMAHAEITKAVAAANEQAERWRDEPAPDDLEDRIRELLELNPEMSWDTTLREIVNGEREQ